MQTYTHASVGLLAGQVLFPHDPTAQAILLVGACVPDTVSISQYVLDLARGKRPLLIQSKGFVRANNCIHSLVMWLPALLCLPFGIAIYSHLILDAASHKDTQYETTDPSMVWPLPFRIRGLFEYRKGHGNLFTPLDLGISLVCFISALALALWW